jgi:hypothetical protein
MLRAVKERHQNIPREHELWQPIFPPFLTDGLQERFWHLREEWDESAKTWKHTGERRYMLVTVCKQVAGESLFNNGPVKSRSGLKNRYVGGLVRYMDSIGRLPRTGDTTFLAPGG